MYSENEDFQRVLASVARTLEGFASDVWRQCPECGRYFSDDELAYFGDAREDDVDGEVLEEDEARCPYCFEPSPSVNFETSLEEYLESVLDVRAVIDVTSGNLEGDNFVGCQVHLYGYPSTWIDTIERAVEIHEGAADPMRHYISCLACGVVDDFVREHYLYC